MSCAIQSLKMKQLAWKLILVICLFLNAAWADGPVYLPPSSSVEDLLEGDGATAPLPTVTVRGFLNFRTTVDGTVIVFTPASEAAPQADPSRPSVEEPPQASARGGDEVGRRAELENEAHTPEDDRQNFRHQKPGQLAPTTEDSPRRAVEPPPDTPHQKPTQAQYPTGLVTVLGGTHITNGATTVFETKVIGTYIEGKYAQILQSTSQIIFPAKPSEEIPLSTPKPSKSTAKAAAAASSQQLLLPSRPNEVEVASSSVYVEGLLTSKEQKVAAGYSRQADRRTDEPLNANTVLQSSFKLPEANVPVRTSRPTESLESSLSKPSYTISRRFRPSPASEVPPEDENTVPESQNSNGRNLPRFRYVLPRRNSPSVRLNRFKVKLTVRNDGGVSDHLSSPHDNTFDPEDDLLEEFDPNVDPAKVVFEKTTITSEVTLHVGRRKSVRTLTITTSVPRTRHGVYASADPLHDLAPQHHPDVANHNALFATLGPLDDDHGLTHAPQVVVTRTYTTTERMLKTSVVPVVLDNETTSFHTVTESFFILKLITGYKTMPAGEMTMILNDTGLTGGDLELDETQEQDLSGLLDGAVHQLQPSPSFRQQIVQTPVPNGLLQASGSGREPAIVPYHNQIPQGGANPMDLSNSLMSLGAALQQNPLAAVYLGLQQLNRQATLYSTFTKTSTYIHTDTIYSTKVVSFYDGRRTRTRTLSESISTTEKTMTALTTTVQPYLNTQFDQLQQLLGGGGSARQMTPPQQYSTVTSTYTTVTTATSLSTRIYTLIYNALSTKFRTVTSTSLYETTVTATSTSEVPIAITAPPGGVFPFLG